MNFTAFCSSRSLRRTLLVFACLSGLTACATDRSRPVFATESEERGPAATLAPTFVDPRWPVDIEAYRTTREDIYLGNLDAKISEHERVLVNDGSAGLRNALAAALYHRFKVIGNLEDAERALVLVDLAVREEDAEASHRLLRATILSAFHRFAEAEADLAVARAAGDTDEIRQAQREIDLALGRYDRLAQEFAQSSGAAHDFYELAHRADLRLLEGDAAGANQQFRAAQIVYGDSNPVPLSWLHVQRGIGALRFGDIEDAKRFFAASHARMPRYYLAVEHLAETETELGNFDHARRLYAAVIEQTHNPEFLAAMGSLEWAAGRKEEARRWNARARESYAALHARHPDAYGQHYAEFLLDTGNAPRAFELAERNIVLRQDVGSWILLAKAAEAASELPRACVAQQRAADTGRNPPEMAELAAIAARCKST